MNKSKAELELFQYRGNKSTVFTGRPQGEEARKKLFLDKHDSSNVIIHFLVPSDTTTITPSFFLGLLYNSIKKLGFQNYKDKYFFVFQTENKEVKDILIKDIEEGERNALNTLKGERGIGRFLKK